MFHDCRMLKSYFVFVVGDVVGCRWFDFVENLDGCQGLSFNLGGAARRV